jgi:hypothetical protein
LEHARMSNLISHHTFSNLRLDDSLLP